MSRGKKVAIGTGILAASAATAGAYYLLGPDAKKHQKKAIELMTKMKKEVESEIEKVKEVTPPLYHKAVDFVAKNYSRQYKLHGKEIKAFAKKLKKEWKAAK